MQVMPSSCKATEMIEVPRVDGNFKFIGRLYVHYYNVSQKMRLA